MAALVTPFVALGIVLPWLGTVVAVARDAQARVANPAARRAAIATALLLPFCGALAWLCVRPAETRTERRERRLRLATIERELQAAHTVPHVLSDDVSASSPSSVAA